MINGQKCEKHAKQYAKICLAEDCQASFLLCDDYDLTHHKHSKAQILSVEDIKQKLRDKWEPKQSVMDGYAKKIKLFYQNLRKQISKLLDEDQRVVESIIEKLKYHHLPVEANSSAYIQLMRSQYDKLDKNTIVTLLNQAENGQQNKDLQKQKQICNFLDLQLKKLNDKLLTLKYVNLFIKIFQVLLSKKLQTQMLIPQLSQSSKVVNNEQFIKIYSLFNSRKMLIRSIKLIYRAKDNQFSSKSFYNNCIEVYNCLVVAKGKNNKVYGGFSPCPFVYHNQEEIQNQLYLKDDTKKSFIFSISNLKSYNLKDFQRALIYKKQNEGPCFGVDLQIGRNLKSSIGNSYESPGGIQVDSLQSKVYLLEDQKVQTQNFEIWQISF